MRCLLGLMVRRSTSSEISVLLVVSATTRITSILVILTLTILTATGSAISTLTASSIVRWVIVLCSCRGTSVSTDSIVNTTSGRPISVRLLIPGGISGRTVLSTTVGRVMLLLLLAYTRVSVGILVSGASLASVSTRSSDAR